MRLSFGMPSIRVPGSRAIGRDGYLGLSTRPSDVLSRWLQAEVWMRRGEPHLAWSVLGDPPSWREMFHAPRRFYQDVGLYAELSGSPRANEFYALAELLRPFRSIGRGMPMVHDPVIADLPDGHTNYYRSWSGQFLAGSLAGYAAAATAAALTTEDGKLVDHQYVLAMEALENCIRRGIRPDAARSLRGRLRAARGLDTLAEADYLAAHAGFAARGEVEPSTSLRLGLLSLTRSDAERAARYFGEAVTSEPGNAEAWNGLGVSRVQLGESTSAGAAFDEAPRLDPDLALARFNRGLLRCQLGLIDEGLADFEVAARLDPGNQRMARTIQLAEQARRQGVKVLPGLEGATSGAALGIDPGAGAPMLSDVDTPSYLRSIIREHLEEQGLILRTRRLDGDPLTELTAAHGASPTLATRKTLAFALAALARLPEAQALLADGWRRDLDPDEIVLLIWLDMQLGTSTRIADLARSADREALARATWSPLKQSNSCHCLDCTVLK